MLNELLVMTSGFIHRPDLIQGPGGNTSVKDDSGIMLIKASGFRFEEMSETKGVSGVNYLNIREYFHSVKPQDKVIEEKRMNEVIARNILEDAQGNLYPKPSMETGFHAVLDRYVIHTHSVWTNLVNCAENRTEFIQSLRQGMGADIADIPFVSPGFGLSYLVTEALKTADESGKNRPSVFLLANHGVIAHANTAQKAADLLFALDKAIASLLDVEMNYPKTDIVTINGNWCPDSSFAKDMIVKHKADEEFFNRVLFPDQTVFFKDNLNFGDDTLSRKINYLKDELTYVCSEREARSIHETMTAYLFIYDQLATKALGHKFIGSTEIDYINAMDMEKHRKSLF